MLTREEIAHDLFSTVTHKDFSGKPTKRRKPIIPFQYKNVIAEGFELSLKIEPTEELEEPIEDADKYLLKLREKYKKTGERYFKKPLDHSTVKDDEILKGNTTYKIDYCNILEKLKRNLLEQGKEKKDLPPGWKIPETTIQHDYRDPTVYDKTCFLNRTSVIIPPTSLGGDEVTNKILNVKTGITQYEDTYNTLGDIIIRNKLFGNMIRPKV